MLRHRGDTAKRKRASDPFPCPSFEELSARSAVLAYVVGEGHHDETILTLAQELSPSGHSDAVERAVRDLVGEGLLAIKEAKVIPGRKWSAEPSTP